MQRLWSCLVLGLFLVGCFSPALADEEKAAAEPSTEPSTMFKLVDFNHDGKISLEEHLAWEKGVFASNDRDGDGYITSREVAEFQLERMNKMHTKTGEKMEFKLQDYTFSPELDLDGDGKISLAEHLAWETKNFHANDLNGDGYIVWNEILERQRLIMADIKQKLSLLRQQQKTATEKPPAERNYQD